MEKNEIKKPFIARNEIMKAFWELLSEKPYMDITVSDIVKRAQIARTSFYRNFASISDVVDAIAEKMFQNFEENTAPVLLSNNKRKWREFLFHFFYQAEHNFKNVTDMNIRNLSIFFTYIDEKTMQLQQENPAVSMHEKYGTIGKMALIFEIAKKWAMEGAIETPEEMVDYIMSFITEF